MNKINYILISLSFFFITSCSLYSKETRVITAFDLAKNSDFLPFSISTRTFSFAGFKKIKPSLREMTIYIEGDGRAWIDRYTVSNNPTPNNPLALKLALLDTSPNVVYLARPCQYVDLGSEKHCSQKTWTSNQFSKKVITAYNNALDEIIKVFNIKGFHLVGFSGGGAIAALLTENRTDIISLRTVAGNLDHEALTNYHKATFLSGSLNPIKIASSISHIPQRHYSGDEDVVVPTWVAKSFVDANNNSKCVDQKILPNIGHISGWQMKWAKLSNYIPKC